MVRRDELYDEESKLESEIEALKNPIIEWQGKFKKKIQNCLNKHLDPNTRDRTTFYKDLLEKLHKADSDLKIITTNYDLLLDKALGSDLNDGFVSEYESTIKVWRDRWKNHPSRAHVSTITWCN